MKSIILYIIAFVCISSFAFAQESPPNTQRKNTFAQFKVGGGVYFLRNAPITDFYQTNAFFIPNIGIEIIGKNIGVYADVASTFTINTNTDSLNVFNNSFNFRQTHINAGLLSRAKLHSNIFFRGKLGLSYVATRETFFDISNQALAPTIGAGFEFQVSPTGIYFVEMNYLYQRTKESGTLGGFNLMMGFKFGRVE
ncbi:MAG TPA: hypothetical protein DCS93_31730 [Microscillaceae bacterium]|nr:hypothetical protein [Microscillaceae bacterium]